MRITKFGHSCVRIETGTTTVVLDPGVFATAEALDGADAILITHEHPDHYAPALLAASDAQIFTIDAVAAKIAAEAPAAFERTTVVTPDQSFTIGDAAVRVVGEQHALLHAELPKFYNSGYLLTADDTTVFHPGDSLTGANGAAVDVLLAPVSAPWATAAELIDFIRMVGAPRSLAIHDRVYGEFGSKVFDGQAATLLPETQTYTRLADGADL